MAFLFQLFKTVFFFVGLFLFFILAFTFNLLQLLNYLFFNRWQPALRRLINNSLQDVVLSSFLLLFELYNNAHFQLHFDTETTRQTLSHRNALLIVNHSHQLDAFFYWQCCQQLGALGSIKAFTRATYRWMPIVGWMLWFNESIFLQQNWRKDERNIRRSLDRLRPYVAPYVLAFAPEGTRFTAQRYCDSQAFIEEFQLPIKLKHHLLPRVKGFTTTLKHMLETKNVESSFSVYNVEFVAQVDSHFAEPTLGNFLSGQHFKVDCYVAKIPQTALPKLNAPNSEYTAFLYNLFQEKDRLVDKFTLSERFTEDEVVASPKQITVGQLTKFLVFGLGLSGLTVFLLAKLAIAAQGMLAKVAGLAAFSLICYTMKATLKMVED